MKNHKSSTGYSTPKTFRLSDTVRDDDLMLFEFDEEVDAWNFSFSPGVGNYLHGLAQHCLSILAYDNRLSL